MVKYLKIIIFIFTMSVLSFTNVAFASSHIKIAILPPINSAKYPDQEIQEVIQQKTSNYFKFPHYDKIAPLQVAKTVRQLEIKPNMKKVPAKEILAKIADKLSADIVFVVQINKIESVFRSGLFDGDSLEDTYVHLTCAVYLSKQDRYFLTEAIASEFVEPAVDTGAKKMTGECMNIIIQKIDSYLAVNRIS